MIVLVHFCIIFCCLCYKFSSSSPNATVWKFIMRMFFIYDSTFCKTDEDDPKDAILYIFPHQLYENHYYSLCGQIVGIAKFLQTNFSSPSLIVLDQGKFAFHWSGKYLLVLGESSEEIHTNVLKRHLLFLCGIFCFYHGSLSNLLKDCNNDRELFLTKMELAWSRYIMFTECFNNFLHISVNIMPISFFKRHAEAIIKAKQLLHLCQMSASVLAGAVFCNSRILSSQFPPELTSFLTLMSNENACAPVNRAQIAVKKLPLDVELKYVYLNNKVIQNIIKYNHSVVGTAIRVKMNETPSKQHSVNLHKTGNSGSEGDIDSGNYTENLHSRKATIKGERNDWTKLNFRSLILCCSMHTAMFRKDVLICRNRSFLDYLNFEYISEKLKNLKERTSLNFKITLCSKSFVKNTAEGNSASCHLLCHYHANRLSSYFHSKSTHRHANFSSTCDLEYSCCFCINHRLLAGLETFSLKKWNSCMHIPDYLQYVPEKNDSSKLNPTENKQKKRKTSKCKIQILKCRSKCNMCAQCLKKDNLYSSPKKNCELTTISELQSQPSKHKTPNLYHSAFSVESYWENVEKNDLQKSVLYVQRCDNNIILLLLNRIHDENILTYLWNCGFTFLSDLNSNEHIEEGSELDFAHYIMIYDSINEALRVSPFHHDPLSEKHVKESIQSIQDHFQSNHKFHMCTLLSSNDSIFACQAKQQSAFYLQRSLTSRRVESLCNLSRKAVRRLEKYFKATT